MLNSPGPDTPKVPLAETSPSNMSYRPDSSFSFFEPDQQLNFLTSGFSGQKNSNQLPTITNQRFHSKIATCLAGPDVTRFLGLIAAHELPIVREEDFDFSNKSNDDTRELGAFVDIRLANWKRFGRPSLAVAVKQFRETRFWHEKQSDNRKEFATLFHGFSLKSKSWRVVIISISPEVLGISFHEPKKSVSRYSSTSSSVDI